MKRIKDELPFFKRLMQGMAAQFGSNCEIVLHDYENEYEHTIALIENGHVTGRKVGDCGTNLGLEVLRGVLNGADQYNYRTQTADGKVLRSTSVYIEDDEGKVIGCLCVNMDITNFLSMETTIHALTNGTEASNEIQEHISDNVNEILDNMIQDSIKFVGKPVATMTREDKIKGLRYLDSKGAFLIKRAGDRVAQFYDISKNTIYNYLE